MTITHWPHYEVRRLESLEDVWECFPDGKADELNWLVCSMSGVHGSYVTLDELLEEWDDPRDGGEECSRAITVLVIQPRLVVLRYGELVLTSHDEVARLRRIVTSSLGAIARSQKGNL